MTPTILPLTQKLRKTSLSCSVVESRQKTLEQLYLRRATLDTLIHSLEVYDRTARLMADRVVSLR